MDGGWATPRNGRKKSQVRRLPPSRSRKFGGVNIWDFIMSGAHGAGKTHRNKCWWSGPLAPTGDAANASRIVKRKLDQLSGAVSEVQN